MNDEEKNLLTSQAELYLSGKSLREIASIYKVSHVTIRNNLTKRLKDADLNLYKLVLEKIDATSFVDKDRILLAYHLLVDEEKTVLEIVDEINKNNDTENEVTEFMIYRDLTRRLPRLCETNPDEVTLEMVERVKKVLNEHRLNNLNKKENTNYTLNGKSVYQYLGLMYPKKDTRFNVIKHIALTFGLRLEALCEVMRLDVESMKDVLRYNNGLFRSLSFLFEHGFVYQENAKERFWQYFKLLVNAWKKQDKEELRNLLDVISDKQALAFKKRHLPDEKITDEDIGSVLRFQLKYGLDTVSVCCYFEINRNNYVKRIYRYTEDKPRLRSDYEYLADFYSLNWRRK